MLDIIIYTIDYGNEINTDTRCFFLLEKSTWNLLNKQKIAKETGMPLNKEGLERKIGSVIIKSIFGKKMMYLL